MTSEVTVAMRRSRRLRGVRGLLRGGPKEKTIAGQGEGRMPRSRAELLKEAGDIARRADVQIILLATALVIIALAMAQAYWSPSAQGATASGTPGTGAGHMTDAPYWPKGAKNCATGVTPVSRCVDLFFIRFKKIEETQRLSEARRKAAATSLGHFREATSRGQRRLAMEQLEQSVRQRRIAKADREEARKGAAPIAASLTDRVSFKLPGGIDVPVVKSAAPAVWLFLLGLLLLLALERRRLFWVVWDRAGDPERVSETPSVEIEAHDLPLWLGPAPWPQEARAAELTAGFRQDQALRLLLTALAAVAVAFVVVAVGWTGARFDYFLAITAGNKEVSRAAWNALWATMGFAGADLVLLASVAGVRAPRAFHAHSLNEGRRGLLLAAVGGGLIAMIGAATAFPLRRILLQPRYLRRQRRTADLGKSKPGAGFYANTRSGAVHYVNMDGQVSLSGPALKARNLSPLPLSGVRPRIRLVHAEQAALDAWVGGQAAAAIDIILATLQDDVERKARKPLSHRPPHKPHLRLLNLAAGMALVSNQPDQLLRVVAVLKSWMPDPMQRGMAPPAAPGEPPPRLPTEYLDEAEERLRRWTSDDHLHWRRKRWPVGHPLHWNGYGYRLRAGSPIT